MSTQQPMSPLNILGVGADAEGNQRDARRTRLRLLLARLDRGVPLTEDERALLRQDIESEIRDADAARRSAELADSVVAQTKSLLERRTTKLRHRAERAEAAIGRARALANRWALLRSHGSAATELRAALAKPKESTTP